MPEIFITKGFNGKKEHQKTTESVLWRFLSVDAIQGALPTLEEFSEVTHNIKGAVGKPLCEQGSLVRRDLE